MDQFESRPVVPTAPGAVSPAEAELLDEVVVRDEILGPDGAVIGEHIEVIDLVEIDGEGVVIIDDVTIITDDDGDVLIEETVATFDESGAAIVEVTNTIIDAEGDVMIDERTTVVAPDGETFTTESVTVVDAEELDDRALATSLRTELDDVETALARLDAGTYATCESCGGEIDDEVLATRPQARACAAHLLV